MVKYSRASSHALMPQNTTKPKPPRKHEYYHAQQVQRDQQAEIAQRIGQCRGKGHWRWSGQAWVVFELNRVGHVFKE